MKLTLWQFFALSLLALALALGLLFYVVFASSRASVIESSERIREGASHEIGERVAAFLAKAPAAAKQFQLSLEHGLVSPGNPLAVEQSLLSVLLSDENLGEVSFTYARQLGFAPDGAIQLAPAPRGEVSVWRQRGAEGQILSRHLHAEGDRFVADRRVLTHILEFTTSREELAGGEAVPDPTSHLTFTTPARKDFYGRVLWSDLQLSPIDMDLPESQRRVEVSVQQALEDAEGKFAGVLRVGLLTQQLDRAVQIDLEGHTVFICDHNGHLITRGMPGDPLADMDGDLRVVMDALPKPIAVALRQPQLAQLSDDKPVASAQFGQGGREYLVTFRALPETQDWVAGILVPRAFYLGKLVAMRNRLLAISLGIMAVLIIGGELILRGVKAAQARIVRESRKMNAFEFTPSSTDAPFRDVSIVLDSLEQAKTAMRAMGKYVPIDLVRRLYHDRSEPELGGEEREITLMFTDIRDFTAHSEGMPPGELASALGRYLEVMAGVIQQETGGTIDKYIGDAIMTFWNAPEPVPAHPQRACLAALRCCEASAALFRSPEWQHPPFETRFGLHCDTALVGHFGAPDRMNYTAIGDAVNLASRLEGLNKYYGTSIIVSERIVAGAGEEFAFRLLDWVAVKGKKEGVKIYELLGLAEEASPSLALTAYEKAFAAYLARDFAGAAALLAAHPEDSPSVLLLKRCREYEAAPPPPEWNGVYIATAK